MSPTPRPPSWAARLLAFAFHDEEFAESILGDLAEERASRLSRRARFNTLWFWGEVLRIALRATTWRAKPSSRGELHLGAWLADVGRGFRSAVRHRLLLGSAAVAIALGIASPTTIFSIVRGLSRDLPFPQGDRIVYVTRQNQTTGDRDIGLTSALALGIAHEQRSLAQFAEFIDRPVSLGEDDGPAVPLHGAVVSSSTFDALGVKPIAGSAFTEDDARRGADVALISHDMWLRRFGGSSSVLGRVIRLNGRSTRIIGVMPTDFRFPFKNDIWQPLALRPGAVEMVRSRRLDAWRRTRACRLRMPRLVPSRRGSGTMRRLAISISSRAFCRSRIASSRRRTSCSSAP